MYNILCIDECSSNLLVLKTLFDSYEDYNIITTSNPDKVIDILLNEKIDLILLDVIISGTNGFEIAKQIQANSEIKDIPIMFVTTKKDKETIHNAFRYGVDYLSKPYDEFELMTRIQTQISLIHKTKQIKEQIEFNQSILDSQHHIIFIQDDNHILKANKSFLKFFDVKSVDEFNSRYNNIADLFMEYENYFSLNVLNSNKFWCDVISNDKNSSEYNILIMDISTFTPKAFKIDVNTIDNTDKFVVTLTDITTLTTKSKQFENKATYDALTNIYNRSKFNELLAEHYELFKRYDEPLCFAIFDIDFFKKVNDTYGHVVGDETLIKFASTIENAVRATDIFARWGGEEFTLLMPQTNLEDGFKVVDKLRELISKTPFKTIGNKTCSVGVTQFRKGDSVDSVLIRADEALYEAKESGRNKVCSK